MKIALNKVTHATPFGRLLNDLTGALGYCHAELVFPDVDTDGALCFSSAAEDGGTRFKRIVLDDADWTVFDVPTSDEQTALVRAWCTSQLGLKYDYEGVVNFFLSRGEDRGEWFCSEVCTAGMQSVNLWAGLEPWHVSPNSLYLYLLQTISGK